MNTPNQIETLTTENTQLREALDKSTRLLGEYRRAYDYWVNGDQAIWPNDSKILGQTIRNDSLLGRDMYHPPALSLEAK